MSEYVNENGVVIDEAGSKMSAFLENVLKGVELKGEAVEEAAEVKVPSEEAKEPGYDMSFREKEITIGLLLYTIDGMQSYIDELLSEIEKQNTDIARIAELEAKNAEYKAAMVRMRSFMDAEAEKEEDAEEECGGHALLARNGKILVLGATALNQNTMNGIAKLYGFHKDDFEYETDYTKVVNFAGRINNSERYAAIIFGACPHKVGRLGDWSSLIEKYRQSDEVPCTCDARSRSGELKVTKESFKEALMRVCNELREKVG